MSMNYVSVVSVAAFLFISFLWYGAGKNKSFTGPGLADCVLQGIEPIVNIAKVPQQKR